MTRGLLALTAVSLAALVAPAAGQAHPKREHGLKLQLELPLTFSDPTSECPGGTAHFGISANRRTGTGENCLLGVDPADCPPEVVALFCENVRLVMTLRLHGGRLDAPGSIFEAWKCGDPDCGTFAVDQQWHATVRSATARLSGLEGATISGGGIAVFDAATFAPLSLDEVLLLAPPDEHADA